MENYGKIIHRTWDNSYVIKDGKYHVPNNEEFKTQWEQVHAYALANPNMITEEEPYVPPVPTEAEIQKALTDGVQNWMDTKVQERNYDNVHTCVGTYLYSPVDKFRIEAEHVKDWVSYVWAKCYEILAQVKNGEREIPTLEEVINELPILDWGVDE